MLAIISVSCCGCKHSYLLAKFYVVFVDFSSNIGRSAI
uniref:Uncharacterized protein n=1 Tax=Arundo donax TaxID=35708 RepID=A0A0A9B5A8_ARUDO